MIRKWFRILSLWVQKKARIMDFLSWEWWLDTSFITISPAGLLFVASFLAWCFEKCYNFNCEGHSKIKAKKDFLITYNSVLEEHNIALRKEIKKVNKNLEYVEWIESSLPSREKMLSLLNSTTDILNYCFHFTELNNSHDCYTWHTLCDGREILIRYDHPVTLNCEWNGLSVTATCSHFLMVLKQDGLIGGNLRVDYCLSNMSVSLRGLDHDDDLETHTRALKEKENTIIRELQQILFHIAKFIVSEQNTKKNKA